MPPTPNPTANRTLQAAGRERRRLATFCDSPPLRVLLVAHNLGEEARAGTENYCLKLGQALAEAGVAIVFLAPQGPPAESPEAPVPWRQGRLAGLPFLQYQGKDRQVAAIQQEVTRQPSRTG